MIKKLTLFLVLSFFSVSLFAQSPPTYLSAIEGDEEVTLSWSRPGFEFTEGDGFEYPFIIDDIPFDVAGSTVGFNADYGPYSNTNLLCDWVGYYSASASGAGPDVVYSLTLDDATNLTISLCGSGYDTGLGVFDSNGVLEAANDDSCGFQSEINCTFPAGLHYIVVSGFSTSTGDYQLLVTDEVARNNYRRSTETQELTGNPKELENANKYEIYGTTEPFHEPVPFIVNPDHARNSRDVEVNITCDGGIFQGEISWEILDESGAIVASGGAPVSESFYLDNGVYTVNGLDSWGDGWNGNYLSVVNAANNNEYLNWTIEDGTQGTTTFDIDYTIVAGDLIGYNAYVDGSQHNTDIIQGRNYSVDGLTNNTTYELGVTAVYYVNENETEESEPVTISATPTYLYGDITGVVTDPNGATLDSVVASCGNVSDTTGENGTYTLWNLNTGSQTVTLSRSGFSSVTIDATVLAQAEPTVLDVMLSPDVPWPAGLDATPLDGQVHLSWRTPGNGEELTLQYDDGSLDNAFYFFSTYEEGFAHGIRFDVGGGFDVMAASLRVTTESDFDPPFPNATHGPVRVLIFDDNNGVPGNLLYDEEAVAEDGWATVYPDLSGLEGSVYVIATHVADWADPEGFGVDGSIYSEGSIDYPDNMYTLNAGVWATGDVLGYGGDYMMAVQVMSYGGGVRTLSSFDSAPDMDYDGVEINSSLIASTNGLTPVNLSESSAATHPVFNTPINTPVNRDDLLEYRVYEVATDGLETFVVTTEDTFATVTASPNYLEYCYHVRAVWDTGDPSDGGYGQLESRASNVACTVPYTLGDADFDSDVTINDVLEVVDFILEEDVPTEDQIRNCDVNSDEEINIADVVMMVDIIFGGTGRIVGVDAGEIAYIDLKTDFKKSLLTFEIEYNGPVRGIEFELKFDPTMVNVMPPSLLNFQENVMISYTEKEPGILKVLAADLQGGYIEATDNSYMSIPVEFMGNERENSFVTLDGIKLAGADGSLINTVSRTNSSEVKVIPGAFALHQNFPNPFNPSTEIRFDLPEAGNVNLAIYNLMGQKIRTLSSDNMTPGYHAIIWDGTNDIGSQVATGMYFYSIQSNEFQATKKMLFLK